MEDADGESAIEIDGSHGEGGGQVLRTSLSLAVLTGRPLRIRNIRAGRSKPGLAAQHLTCVRAAAAICNAGVRGDSVGSTWLEFQPSGPVQAGGHHTFDVGTAGAVSLVLQTVLLPLAMAGSGSELESRLLLRGGTHVPFSPQMTYIQEVFLPTLARMDVHAEVKLSAWGWNPKGRGQVEVVVKGCSRVRGLVLLERGDLVRLRGVAAASHVPDAAAEQAGAKAGTLLREGGVEAEVESRRVESVGAGMSFFLTAQYEGGVAGFGALGSRARDADRIAQEACREMLQFRESGAPVDEHLADQLLLPAALAVEESRYKVAKVSLHLTTNAWVIHQFGLAEVTVDEASNVITVRPRDSVGT